MGSGKIEAAQSFGEDWWNHPDACAGDLDVTRREFVWAVGALSTAAALGITVGSWEGSTVLAETLDAAGKNTVPVNIVINGQEHRVSLDPRVTLLDLLRENLGLTG